MAFSKAHRAKLSAAAKKREAAKRKSAPKKRGVKPGTKRGPYKTAKEIKQRVMTLDDYAEKILKPMNEKFMAATETPVELSLCQQLEETIQRFENRISNSIGRLNELMGKI